MSIKLMSIAWDMDIPSTEKMVLLCLCDYADDNGRSCYPAISTLAKRTSKNARTVQRALRWLEQTGICDSHERAGTSTNYTINLGGDILSGVTKTTKGGGVVSGGGRRGVTQSTNEPPIETNNCETDVSLKPEHVVEIWNKTAVNLGKPKVRDITPERRQLLKARIAQYSVDDFIEVFGKVERSKFLRGDTGWRGCGFDWVFKKANFQKILEGNYDE